MDIDGAIAARLPLAFVFAGGGSLGAIQVGMLRALVAAGVRPDLVVGTSAGALNAVGYAGEPTEQGVERLASSWRAIGKVGVIRHSPWRLVSAVFGRAPSLVATERLEHAIASRLGVSRLEETQIPCYVIASDARTGAEVVMHEGDALDAVMASAAVPVVFPPRTVDGVALVDGAVANNTPITTAYRLGARRILVLPAGHPCAPREEPSSTLERVMHTFSLLVARQLAADAAVVGERALLHIVPPLCPLRVSPLDFSQTHDLIADAHAQTRDWLDAGGMGRQEHAENLRPHIHGPGGVRLEYATAS